MSTRTAEEIDAAIIGLGAIPPGYQYSLIWIAYTKMMLARVPMERGEQLDWLKKLNAAGKGDLRLTPAVVAAVPPLSDPAARIVDEAMRLDPDEAERREIGARIVEIPPGRNSYNLLTSPEVFSVIARLTPGFIDACKMLYPRGTVTRLDDPQPDDPLVRPEPPAPSAGSSLTAPIWRRE